MSSLSSAHQHAWDSSTQALLSTYNRVYSVGSVNRSSHKELLINMQQQPKIFLCLWRQKNTHRHTTSAHTHTTSAHTETLPHTHTAGVFIWECLCCTVSSSTHTLVHTHTAYCARCSLHYSSLLKGEH